jgi:hypothetical protein
MELEAPGVRLPLMRNSYSCFLEEAADRLLELADRAPDIGTELRRFAADLMQLAAEVEKWKDRSLDLQ